MWEGERPGGGGGGGSGVLYRVLYGQAPPRGSTLYPFVHYFDRKGTPFKYLKLKKKITPFTYILN